MATKLGKILADFTTSLATALIVGGTTASLQTATDDDGVALPSGRYFFAIDGANSSKEHISADLVGTSLTNIKSLSRQGVETAGVVRAHRIGATVTLTDFAHIKFINDLLAGTTNFDASTPLGYDGTASITSANQFATKAYVDGVAIAGAPDSSTTVKGIVKMSVAPASPTAPIAVGDNDGRVPTQGENDALVGNDTSIAIGSGNKFVSQTGLQKMAEISGTTTGSANAYAITLAPVPAAYVTGMVVEFISNFANTGSATLNVNGLGAKTIKKGDGATNLASGDIASGQAVRVKYDGTNFQMLSPVASASPVVSGTISDNNAVAVPGSGSTNTDTVVTHGLGYTPRLLTLYAKLTPNTSGAQTRAGGFIVYNSAGSIVGGMSVRQPGSSGTPDRGEFDVSTLGGLSVSGAGATYASLTVSIINITSTQFTLRITGTQGSGAPANAGSVTGIGWTAI